MEVRKVVGSIPARVIQFFISAMELVKKGVSVLQVHVYRLIPEQAWQKPSLANFLSVKGNEGFSEAQWRLQPFNSIRFGLV